MLEEDGLIRYPAHPDVQVILYISAKRGHKSYAGNLIEIGLNGLTFEYSPLRDRIEDHPGMEGEVTLIKCSAPRFDIRFRCRIDSCTHTAQISLFGLISMNCKVQILETLLLSDIKPFTRG